MKVIAAIGAVQEELSRIGIQKDRKNAQQGFKFRGIDDIYNVVAPLLAKHHLVIIPTYSDHRIEEREAKSGQRLNYAFVTGRFRFYAEDGSTIEACTIGEAMDSADKATNKAMSAAYKYAIMQAFAIPTDADNDADATTHEVRPSQRSTFEESAPAGEELEKAGQAALLSMAELVGKGMGAIQSHMETLPQAVQSHLRTKHREALKSLKTAVDKAQAGE